jgi:hypothetical protein
MMHSLSKEQLEEVQKHFCGAMMMIKHDSFILTMNYLIFHGYNFDCFL